MLGPAPPAVGGMVTVMRLLLESPLGEEASLCSLPTNRPWGRKFGRLGALVRHAVLMVTLLWRVTRGRIDLVHIHTCSFFTFYRNLLDMFALHLFGRKVVMHIHGSQLADFYEGASGIGRAIIRGGLRRADTVIVLSQRWHQWVCWCAPDARVRIVANGVPLGPDIPRRPRERKRPCRFLCLSQLCRSKGVFDLVLAAERLHGEGTQFEVVLAGPWSSANEEKRFHSLLQLHGIRNCVRDVGSVSGERCRQLLDEADVFVLPSLGEVMPMSVLEAMSRSLPVIGTDVGAVPEVVGDGGIIVTPGDVCALASAMQSLAAAPEERARLGRNAHRRIAERYTDAAQARAVFDLYRALIASAPAPLAARG